MAGPLNSVPLMPQLPPLATFTTVGSTALWVGFSVLVLILLALDLFVFHRKVHKITTAEAFKWTVFWVSLAVIFCTGIYLYPWPLDQHGNEQGTRLATEFLTGYLIEEALSVDNLFVILVIFTYFKVPSEFQHRVLFWGILGAMVMRAVFIISGTVLLQNFHHYVIYLFAALLIITGIKMLFSGDEAPHPEKNILVRMFQRTVPSTPEYRGTKFFVREAGRLLATPLLLVLFTVEITDLIFAVDSIPAIFGITDDPFIVYTSNIFAILGLRSMFFLLANMIGKFHYLKIGLALVLVFVGSKMVLEEHEIYKVPIFVSLGVVAALLLVTVCASLIWPADKEPEQDKEVVKTPASEPPSGSFDI
jgi:tellurite resistance protein TerC